MVHLWYRDVLHSACAVAGVRVLEWDGSSWSARGSDILTTGLTSPGLFGSAVSLSCDSSVVAVGASGSSSNNGLVATYQYSSGSWAAYGQSTGFTYTNTGTQTAPYGFGKAVALSADALNIAVGAPTAESSRGAVEVFRYNGASYVTN